MDDTSVASLEARQAKARTARASNLVALLLLLVSLGVILHTWTIYDQTWDEGDHIAGGMEWLANHNFSLDPVDPPLPRIMVALGPAALGLRQPVHGNLWIAGNAILARGNYHRTLYAARAGTLAFFFFGAWLVWSRGRDLLGDWGACVGLGLFVLLPAVMAHSSLATTDASMFAMFFWAVDRAWRFLKSGATRDALLAGVAAGLAMVSKMTATPSLVLAVVLLLLLRWYRKRHDRTMPRVVISWPKLGLGIATCGLVVWAMYFFSVGALAPRGSLDAQKLTALMQRHHLPAAPALAIANHLPAPDFFEGFVAANSIARHSGHSWLLGKNRTHATRWFFPVILAVKMPIPFMLLFLWGLGLALRALWLRTGAPYFEVLVTGAVVPVTLGIASGVNLGSRHIFGMFPFAALLGASAAMWLWNRAPMKTAAPRWIAVALLAWFGVDAAWAAGDPLPWYNEIALLQPAGGGWFEPGSDFDWGQDLRRLPPILAAHHVEHFWFAYSGSADLNRAGLPQWTPLEPGQRVQGWVVISGSAFVGDQQDFGWLAAYRPVAMAGKTMRIYWIPPPI